MSEPVDSAFPWRRTSPFSFIVNALTGLRNAILPIAAVLFGSGKWDSGGTVTVLAVIAVLAFSVGASWVRWLRLRYRLGESDVRLEGGLINRTVRSVPYERIQDVSLEQKFLPRLLGLVEVRFETGAGGKDELKLAYVTNAEGAALREAVRERREESPSIDASPAAATTTEESRPLFAMNLRRLATFGLFEFSLVVFAVLAGVAQQLDFLLPVDVWDSKTWMELVAGPGHWLTELGLAAQVIGAIMALAALSLLGMITGVARTVLRDFGFRLDETPRGLRRRRGLFTRTDVLMPVHRVQALKVTTGIVRHRFGWNGLRVVSLAQDARSESHVVVPFGQMEEIAPVAKVTGFELPDKATSWRRPSARYHVDRAAFAVGACVLAFAGTLLAGRLEPEFTGFASWAQAGLLALAGLSCAWEYFLWRHDRHATDDRQIYICRGWLAPRMDIASRVKLQSVEIAQGPIAARRGYADLVFGVAGGSLSLKGIPLGEARQIRAAVLESINAVDFSRLPG